MAKDSRPILVADPDLTFYEKLKEDPLYANLSLEVTDRGGQAQTLIKENKGQYAGVLISPELKNPSGFSVIKFSLMYQPTVPVFFVESMNTELNEGLEEQELGIAGTFTKPFTLKDLTKKLGPSLAVFDMNSVLDVSKDNKDKVNEELEDTDPNFRPIKAELFISGSKSLFDVYVRLRQNKYIKILQAGDVFDRERVVEYLKKGVTNFFIRKEALESYVHYCDKLTQAISNNEKIELGSKFGFVFNQAEVTLNTMVDMGLDSDSITYAQRYLKNVCHMVDTYGEKSDFIAGLLKQMSQFEHSGAVVMVAALVAKNAGIETEKGLHTLGTAAFLHDIGLIDEADTSDLYSDGEDKIFDEQRVKDKLDSKKIWGDEKALLEKLWTVHPEKGARLLEGEKGVPPLVCQIIRQHHGMRDKEEGRSKGPLHPMAEILEISDEFVRIMSKFSVEEANKQTLLNKLMERIAHFPRRSREPFMQALGFTKKAA